MEIYNTKVIESSKEYLRSGNLPESFIDGFVNNIDKTMYETAVEMLVTGARRNKAICETGINLITLRLQEQQDSATHDESLFGLKPLHNFSKDLISNDKLEELYNLIGNLLKKPAKATRAKATRATKTSSEKIEKVTKIKKPSIIIKKGKETIDVEPSTSLQDNIKPPMFNDSIFKYNNLKDPLFSPKLSESDNSNFLQKIPDSKDTHEDKENIFESDNEDDFNPMSAFINPEKLNMQVNSKNIILESSISNSLNYKEEIDKAFADPFNIDKRSNNICVNEKIALQKI